MTEMKKMMSDIEDRTANEIPINCIEVNAEGVFRNNEDYQKCEVCEKYTRHKLVTRMDGGGAKSIPCCQFPCIAKFERKRRVEERARILWD
jgi:hypothetical protein